MIEIKDGNAFILSGFIEEEWELFKQYIEEHGEDIEKADEIVEELEG